MTQKFLILILLLTIGLYSKGQKQDLYRVALVKYESGIWWQANERGRNEAVKNEEIQILLDGKVMLYIDNGEFVFYPEGKKRKKTRSKEISFSIVDKSWGIRTEDNFRVTIVNNIFVIYKNSAKVGYATDEFEYIDWNNKKNRLYISLTKNQKAIDELTLALNNELNSKTAFIPMSKNKWYNITTESRIGALEPKLFRFDDDKITIRAYAYNFNYINRTELNYKKYNVFLKNTFNGVTSYNGNESFGGYAYPATDNQCYIDFYIVPNFKMDSLKNDATDKKIFDVTMVMGNQDVFKGNFYSIESTGYNSGPEINSSHFYKEYFFEKLVRNKNNEKDVIKIIENPAFNLSSYDDIAIYKLKDIPALKEAADNIINLRVKQGTGSIPFNDWLYQGPSKNNIPNGIGVLTNPSPTGFAVNPVEIEYRGRWDNGKKNGAFTVLTMYYTSLGGGTIYSRKTKY